jgi:hypothetical protein
MHSSVGERAERCGPVGEDVNSAAGGVAQLRLSGAILAPDQVRVPCESEVACSGVGLKRSKWELYYGRKNVKNVNHRCRDRAR